MLGVLGGCGDMIKYFCDICGDGCNCPIDKYKIPMWEVSGYRGGFHDKKVTLDYAFFGRGVQMCDKCARRFYNLYMEMKKENNE